MRRRRHSSRFASAPVALTAALAIAFCGFAARPALALDVTLEGETLTPLGASGGVQPDPHASDGSALRILENGSATGTVTVPQAATHLFVRARGADCASPSMLSVTIDGVNRLVGPVHSGGYGDLSGRLSIAPGVHAVSVSVATGAFAGALLCDRSAWVDNLTVVGQPFAPNGWRNARLSKRAPVAKNSAALVAGLRAQIKSRPNGALIGTTQYSSPIYTVPRHQPTVRVIAISGEQNIQVQWNAVPIPPDARPAAGTDANLVVWQPSTDTMWEFWGLSKDGFGNWQARFGGRMPRVSQDEGQFGDPPGAWFGATATSISILAGTQRIEELRRGVIDHVLDFAVLKSGARDGWCWPAQRTDPPLSSRAKTAIPAGARFRLPPRFDLAAYARDHPLSRYAMTVARAVQRYGFIARDTSSEVGFFAEDPTPLGWNPYGEIFEGRSADSRGVLANFPWRRLQVVAPPAGRRCVDDPDPDR